MQLKLYGTGEYPQGEQHKQQQALDQMETSSSSRSSSRSSCLPIREIKTNRRRTLCNCCTICTISKVTHSAKTNTPAPAHSRKSSICVHDQNPGRDSVSVTVSQSQSQFLSGASSYSYSWSCLRHIMTVFPFLLPLAHSPFSLLPLTIFFFICFFPCFFPFSMLYFPFVGYFCFKLSQLFKLSSPTPSPSPSLDWGWGSG